MATEDESVFTSFENSCLQCRVYRFRDKVTLQNARQIYCSPTCNLLAVHYDDNTLFLCQINGNVSHSSNSNWRIDNVTSFCWKETPQLSADEKPVLSFAATLEEEFIEYSVTQHGLTVLNQLSLSVIRGLLQEKGVLPCDEIQLLACSVDSNLFVVDSSVIVSAKVCKDSCDVIIIARISKDDRDECHFPLFQVFHNQIALLDITANTISLWDTNGGHLIYRIDLSQTKVDLNNLSCWNLSHDLQKLVLVSSDWLVYVVFMPAYTKSYPRSMLIGSHIDMEQLFYNSVHSCKTGDIVWSEKPVNTGGIKSKLSRGSDKKQGGWSRGGKKISAFKKTVSLPVGPDAIADTVIETFELSPLVTGYTVDKMVVGEFVIALELHFCDAQEKALCLVDMTGHKNRFQSLSSNQHIVLSTDNCCPHLIVSEQFLFHVLMQPGFEQEDLVSKLMVYGGARSADTLCDLNKWSRCTVPLNALEIGLKHRQLDTVTFFLKSKENLFSTIKEKPVSPMSSVDETSIWRHPNCYQDDLQQLESALVLLVEAVQTNMATRQSQDFGNKLLTLTLDYLYGLLHDGLAVRNSLSAGETDQHEREDVEKAISIVMNHTGKLRQCLVSGSKDTSEETSDQVDGGEHSEDGEQSVWKNMETEEVLEIATTENNVTLFQSHMMSRGCEEDARYTKVITHGITHVMTHLKRHDIEQARKILLNLGFEVTPKLWELARFVHDRNIQTFVLQELEKSSGLNSDQSTLLAYLQQLFDRYPCSSFTQALLNKSDDTQSVEWSDDNPVALCITRKASALNSMCGDIGSSDPDQSDGLYTEVLVDWLEWWDAETRERVLLDSDVSKPDFQIEAYANKTLLFRYLLSHNMHDETIRLIDCLLKQISPKCRRHKQCREILNALTNQLHCCGSYLRNKIFKHLLRSGFIPEEFLSNFPRLLQQLCVVGGVLQIPHPLKFADSRLQLFHQDFVKYCASTQLSLPLWRYCSLNRIHPSQFSFDDKRSQKWLSNFVNFFSVSKNPGDTQLMFAASLSNANQLWDLDDSSLADLFQEGHDLAAIATLPYCSPPLKQISGEQNFGDLLEAVDPMLLESKLKAYPKLHAALYPESRLDIPQVDIDVYRLLVGNAPLDPRRLFGWQMTNSVAGEDSCKVLPFFSQAELVSKFAYTEKLRFPYYLKHCRPSYAFFSFLATEVESGAPSISSKRIQTACGIALWIAVKNLTNQQIGSACSAFVEMLGHESLLIRTYISVGIKILAHRNSRLEGTLEKRKEISQKNEHDIIDILVRCIQNRRRHGNKVLMLIEEAISIEISQKKIESTSFEAGRKWLLAVVFCIQLGLPLTTTFMEECAQADAWLPFIWFAQLHQFSKHQLQGLLHHFMSRHLRDHLHYVIENADVKSLLPKKKHLDMEARYSLYAKIGLAKEKDEGKKHSNAKQTKTYLSSEEETRDQPEPIPVSSSHSTTDADLYVSEDAASEDVFQVVFSSQESRCPWKSLLYHSIFLRNMLFAELAACYYDASLLVCFCGWLVAMLDRPRHDQFLRDHGTAVCGWGFIQLEALIDIYLKHKWEFTLATGFDIFQPDSPMVPFLKFVAECSQQRNYAKSKAFLEDFKDSMSSFSQRNKNDGLTFALQPVVLGNQEWLEQTTNRILQQLLLQSCYLYDCLQLLRLLDLENIALVFSFDVSDFGRLHKLAQILHSCEIEDINFQAFMSKNEDLYQTEALKAITQLSEKSFFDDARKFAALTNVQADFVTLKQMSLEKQQLEDSLLWRSKVARQTFWQSCADSFTRQKISSSEVVKFFINEATNVKQVCEKAMIYQLCLDQLAEDDTVGNCELHYEIYHDMWQCRIQAKIQTEIPVSPTDPVEEIMSGIEIAEMSKSKEDKSELLHFGRMPCSKKHSSLSQQESEVLNSLVGELLNNGQIREACKVTAVFFHNSQDLAIILTCIRLSLNSQTIDDMEEDLRQLITCKDRGRGSIGSLTGMIRSSSSLSLASAAPVWDFLPGEKEEAIVTMERLLSHCIHGQHCCLRIVTAYKVACILNRSYEDVVVSNEFTVLGDLLKVTSFLQRFSLARDYLSTSSLSDNQVSSFLADSIIAALKVCIGGTNEQEPKTGTNKDLIFNPADGMVVFDQFIKLCQDPSKLGNHLLDAVAANQPGASYTDLSIQTELLILAHECFTVACSMEGISNVLRAARISTDVLVDSQEFTLMIRLLTGVGRFSEMTFIFDALIHHEQFELLLRKGMEKEDKLKIAILDYLKRFHPKDNDNYTMVALNFTMFREIAQMLEDNGRHHVELLKNKPLENTKEIQEVLKKSAVYFSDAADSYVKENCFRHAQQCIRQARLLALQLQLLSTGVILINLSPDGVTSLLNQHPKFSECLIVSEAYGKRADWAAAIYNNVIVNGDFRFLQDLKSHIRLAPAMIADAVDRYQQIGTPSSQCIANIKKLLPYCKDVKTQYTIAKDLGLNDVVATMMKGEAASYLQDVVS